MPDKFKSKIYLGLIAVVVISFVVLMIKQRQVKIVEPVLYSAKLANLELQLEVADTNYLRSRGLSNRQSLPLDRGMFFVFPNSEVQFFWMYQMFFPLDIIWLRDGVVVGLAQNVPVQTSFDVPTVNSGVPVNQVLEINAGLAAQGDIKVGDRLEVVP